MKQSVLVRYGTISEVARFAVGTSASLGRKEQVVIRSHRGVELGLLLEDLPRTSNGSSVDDNGSSVYDSGSSVDGNTADAEFCILRVATDDDVTTARKLKDECERDFQIWQQRIDTWKLALELIDLEWTLDKSKLILYVLNDRGPECTKLALQAAAAGLGTVEVQPVGPEGPVSPAREGGGGCGSGHCGSGGDSGGCCN